MTPDELVDKYHRHAVCLAYAGGRGGRVPRADLRQEAMLAALVANASYDPGRGACLDTWIRNNMRWAVVNTLRRERRSVPLAFAPPHDPWRLTIRRIDLSLLLRRIARRDVFILMDVMTGRSVVDIVGLARAQRVRFEVNCALAKMRHLAA